LLEKLARDKRSSSSFGHVISDEAKNKKVLIKITPGVNVIKLFSFVADDEA
jgi:hypothetical protein